MDIHQRADVQDDTGELVPQWLSWATGVPAAIEPISAREFAANQQILSEVTTRITIRWRPGLDATMRIVHATQYTTDVYNIQAILPDQDSGRDYVTIPVSKGANEG